MSKKSNIALAAIYSLAFLLSGYWLGSQKAQFSMSARFTKELFNEAIEAKHDGAIAQLLNEKRYSDAEDIAQLRYYSRLLLLAETNSSTIGNAASAEVEKTLAEAKDRWRKHQFVMPDARDNEKLVRLMR